MQYINGFVRSAIMHKQNAAIDEYVNEDVWLLS